MDKTAGAYPNLNKLPIGLCRERVATPAEARDIAGRDDNEECGDERGWLGLAPPRKRLPRRPSPLLPAGDPVMSSVKEP